MESETVIRNVSNWDSHDQESASHNQERASYTSLIRSRMNPESIYQEVMPLAQPNEGLSISITDNKVYRGEVEYENLPGSVTQETISSFQFEQPLHTKEKTRFKNGLQLSWLCVVILVMVILSLAVSVVALILVIVQFANENNITWQEIHALRAQLLNETRQQSVSLLSGKTRALQQQLDQIIDDQQLNFLTLQQLLHDLEIINSTAYNPQVILCASIATYSDPVSSCKSIPQFCSSGEYWIQTNSTSSPVLVYYDMNQASCEQILTSPTTTPPSPPTGSIQDPVSSCSDISQDRPSGYYYIQANSTSSPVQVYCDMNRTSCSYNTTGGWMRVANLDMTDPNQTCPAGFKLVILNRAEPPLRLCGRPGHGCVSTTYPTHGVEYSRVCGRVIGYQSGDGEAFATGAGDSIDDVYVHGVSLTYSWPRQHIWTFVSARDEVDSNTAFLCPCTRPELPYTGTIPPFIGQDYFCDTGSRQAATPDSTLYADDPLWDGQGCGGSSTCCQFNNPPWFCKQLPQLTTDDIEMRICANSFGDEDTNLEIVEIFIM